MLHELYFRLGDFLFMLRKAQQKHITAGAFITEVVGNGLVYHDHTPHLIDSGAGCNKHIMVSRIIGMDLKTADDPRPMHGKDMGPHFIPMLIMGNFPNIGCNGHPIISFQAAFRKIFNFC